MIIVLDAPDAEWWVLSLHNRIDEAVTVYDEVKREYYKTKLITTRGSVIMEARSYIAD